jgi:rubredoxin-NAD+ reductase
MTHPIIILGAGLAGWTTAREFRKLDPVTPLLLITADSGDFYAKPSLSNALAQGRGPAQLVSTPAAQMAATLNVTLQAQTRVLAIDPVTQVLTSDHGAFSYGQLVLATGAQPIRLPLAGNAAAEVLSVNSLDDFVRFHARLTAQATNTSEAPASKRVLIMGAGLIGCEFANDLVASGHQVTVVDPATGPVAALLPSDASAQLRAALTAQGVHWHFGSTVQSVQYTDDAAPELQVSLSNGVLSRVDIVLSAIGLRADTTLAQAAGLACERGVQVDTRLQTSAPHVYALGDGAQYASAGSRTLPYVMPIMQAAKALAATLAGTPTELLFGLMPVAIKTPALPIVVAPPAPGSAGDWRSVAPGVWQFIDAQGQVRGFTLTGPQTSQRAAQARLVTA